ncbi:MAG: UvrD-helicase domain-containing protein [Deltaproteobacteria bacterium]|nr:UvrD-helicase domain-containing protein [Deltaproteobacteria bacterium]
MTIAPEILKHYPDLNEAQRRVIAHQEGPLLVIAGPGSGKTYSIVLRALNLLLLGKAEPSQMVLCTFTEKAAFEMRDRIAAAARRVAFENDLSELHVTTIHGLCNRFIHRHRHHSPTRQIITKHSTRLDPATFHFEHFDKLSEPPENDRFLHRWKTKWTAIEGARNYFDKITEELVEIDQLAGSADPFLRSIAGSYRAYESALYQNNRVDFAHLQRIAYDLLADKTLCDDLTKDIRYVLVDEYQDTNTVQEQLLLKLTEHSGNLCVVGDEDQSLYRFRGATVRNILEFPTRFSRVPGDQADPQLPCRHCESLNDTTAGWLPSTGPTPRGPPSVTTKPSNPLLTVCIRSIRPSSASGAGTIAMKPNALQIWQPS